MSSFGHIGRFRVGSLGLLLVLVLIGTLTGPPGASGSGGGPDRPALQIRRGRRLADVSPLGIREDDAHGGVRARIVGGRPANIDEWPFFTSLSDGALPAHMPFCGASLIARRWVLTAAHCVAYTGRVFATIGRDRLREPEYPGEGHAVRQIFVHPSYDENTLEWDAALLRLPRPSKAAVIGMVETTPPDEERVKVAGYGLEREGASQLSSRLKETELKMVGDDRCMASFSEELLHVQSMICAWELDTDSCSGDSGGPLVYGGLLAGLVSWGVGCARPDAPGVYTRVESIRDWIDDVIGRNGQPTVLRSVEKWRRGNTGSAYLYGHFSRPARSVRVSFARSVELRERVVRAGKWVNGLRDGVYAGVNDLTRHRKACTRLVMKARFDDRTISHRTRICLPR